VSDQSNAVIPVTGDAADPSTGQLVTTQSEYDLLFPVIPTELDLTPPDTLDEQLVDDLADFAADSKPLDDQDSGVNDRRGDFAFDWDLLEFFSSERGDPLRVYGDDLVIEWCMKAVNTPKGEYPIYPPDYGCNVMQLIGAALPDPILYSEVAREITGALQRHPRVVSAAVANIQRLPLMARDALFVTVDLTLDTSREPVTLDLRF
jgi:phage baseplate assembly protein W